MSHQPHRSVRRCLAAADEVDRHHLDCAVEDLDAAEARLLEPGAGKPAHQPGKDRWRDFTDPAGHPFCLVRRSGNESAQTHEGTTAASGCRSHRGH
nr:VOC family protein [Streptomyces olivochromogenes]